MINKPISFKQLKIYNTTDYNHLKAVEELLELAEVLQKKVLKRGGEKEPSDLSIVEEIGDVQIRLEILKEMYGADAVKDRIEYKMEKFTDYYNEKRFDNI